MKNEINYFQDMERGIRVWESRHSGKFYLATNQYVCEVGSIDDIYGDISDVDIENGFFLFGNWAFVDFVEDNDGLVIDWGDNYRAGIEKTRWSEQSETESYFRNDHMDFEVLKSCSGRWYLKDGYLAQEISPIEIEDGMEILGCDDDSVLIGKKIPIIWIGESDDAWNDNVKSGIELEEGEKYEI